MKTVVSYNYCGFVGAVANMIWRELDNFSEGAICMVFASEHYDPDDYYHEYDEFIAALT